MAALKSVRNLYPECEIAFHSRHKELFEMVDYLDSVVTLDESKRERLAAMHYGFETPPGDPLISLIGKSIGVSIDATSPNFAAPPPRDDIAHQYEFGNEKFITIQTSSSSWTPNKDWSQENWNQLIGQLTQLWPVVEVGTEAPPREFKNFHSTVGKTSKSEFAQLIARSHLFIGPVSGGMHLAAAYNVPSVIIFGGYESPEGHNYPNMTPVFTELECSPCWLRTDCPYDKKCLKSILPEQIFSLAKKVLNFHNH